MNDLTNCKIEPLRQDGEFAIVRVAGPNGLPSRLMVSPVREQPAPSSVAKLENAFALRDELKTSWAARPVELVKFCGRTALVIDDPSGQFLDELIVEPLAVPDFLHVAIGIVGALGSLHARGLVHKDVKPANLIANARTGEAWLTGFGLTSRLPRHRHAPEAPETIAGTLAYMAPEQTGRMNRSIDSRSDLYSLGVTFYEMLVGALPFTANDPMEWVHCHIARQPVPPAKRGAVPEPLSAIVMKLLAKNAEERYQTAAGLEIDLRRCLSEWLSRGSIDPFPLGVDDSSDQLLMPEKLYGREREVDTLVTAFDRVVTQGLAELVLVSGYSGVGKSSVVNELHKVLVSPRGIFAAGKFDQYKREIPYATLAQAFQTLVRQILVKSEAEVDHWRRALLEALGPNGQLIVNLIPELEFVIGKQPPVADLPPREVRNLFQSVFTRFLGAFATAEHPLVLFLDDLQWLDLATRELLERMLTDPDVRHLLLIGAYRDNEVSASHPLTRTLAAIREAGITTQEIVLSPLGLDDVGRLVADFVRCESNSPGPLAQLIHEKTGGNPFFAIQFLMALAEEGLLQFDGDALCWICHLGRIRAKGYSNNVVDLMLGKLQRLSRPTQTALQQFACLGNVAEIALLSAAFGKSDEGIHADLSEAVSAGLIVRLEQSYAFLHDRIHEAAYALITDRARAEVHLRIGRDLLTRMTEDQIAENLFDVANQLNRGAALLVDHDEKAKVAAVDLKSGRKAKASSAFTSARAYFAAGMALLDESNWTTRYELTFSLWLECVECELLCGNSEKAGQLIAELLPRGATKIDEASVYCLKIRLDVLNLEYQQAVTTGLTCLRELGVDLPAHPTEDQVRAEYEALWHALDGRQIESLINLPLLSDPKLVAAMHVVSVISTPAYFVNHRLYLLEACRMARISMQHGTSKDSAFAYVALGIMLGPVFHRYGDGYRFAKLACDLVEKHGFVANRGKIYASTAVVAAWTQPIASVIDLLRTAVRAAIETGDMTYACYGALSSITCLFLRDDPLDVVWRESEMALDLARKARYADAADIVVSHQRFIASMQDRTTTVSTFSDAQFNEAAFEAQFTEGPNVMMICWYWIIKLKARFLAGNYTEALRAADKAKRLLRATTGQIQQLDYYYYAALTVSALYETASADEGRGWRELLREHQEQLREWAENSPPTFGNKHALVSAEIARIEKRDADAMRLYEQAIRSAREHGFVQNEGLAYEVAARFYAARGFETFADAYLRKARYCYLRWGADGKVQQFDRLYPHLAAPEGPNTAALNATIGTPAGQLDAETVARASQALSGEIVLSKLIERLMRIALEHAGAEHGLLILLRGSEPLIEAEATTGKGGVEVAVRQTVVTPSDLPQSTLHYALRTQEHVLLNDASADEMYSKDAYVRQNRSKSVLCLPIAKQAQIVGVLYLENNLTPGAFTPDRVAVLQLLASQAAISLENAALFTDLKLQVGLLQHLPASAWTLKPDGTPDFVNQVWLEYSGQTLDFVRSHPEAWMTAVHPEDREMAAQIFWEGVHSGQNFAFETRSLRARDGTYRWHLSQAVVLRDSEGKVLKFVGTTTDIDDQKRTAEALRQAQAELAHVTRVMTMGELAASIAHEVNQPIAGVVINGTACLHWLSDLKEDSVNLTEARETLQRIIRDGNRAGEIIARIRALFKKTESAKEPLDLNEAIQEILTLARSEMTRHAVALRLELSSDLPNVLGDRVQLQQVVLNLILNAIEAMAVVEGRSRDLTVQTRRRDEREVVVTVRDSGNGLSPESVGRVFTPFHTTKPGGLGMGLSISRSIVEGHSGRLWATGHEGPGASFHFTLPSCPSQ